MSPPNEHDGELSPEQEAEAQRLLRQAGLIDTDEESKVAGIADIGGARVALDQDDVQRIHDTAVEVILANIEAEAPIGRQAELKRNRQRRQEGLMTKVGRWIFTVSVSTIFLSGTIALVRWLLF